MAKRVVWLALAVVAVGCGPKAIRPLPTVSAPKYPTFIAPSVPIAFANTVPAANQSRGWTFLQAGDLKSAEREFAAALRVAPGFYPAEVGLAWVDLARQDGKAALARFDAVLERQRTSVSVLAGRGEALLLLDHEAEALTAFEAALMVDPSLSDIARRVEVLRLRGQQQELAGARASARAGRFDEAIRAYEAAIASSPASPFLYHELAAVERQKGDNRAALEHFRKAVDLDPGDAQAWTEIGGLLEAAGDFDGAVDALNRAKAIDPTSDLDAKIDAIRDRAALARLPAEYRAIPDSMQITRGELAALIGVRLAPLLQPDRRQAAVVITDLRNQWAADWIVAVARAGVMEPFANHAFQPRTVVRRIDLAPVIARLLARVGPRGAGPWQNARLKFSDVAASHAAYAAASAAVASGVMRTAADGSFQPSRPVTGQEAIDAIDAIGRLAALPNAARRGRS